MILINLGLLSLRVVVVLSPELEVSMNPLVGILKLNFHGSFVHFS